MAELNIKLSAQAEITNMSEIYKAFSDFGALSDTVKNNFTTAVNSMSEGGVSKVGGNWDLLHEIKEYVKMNYSLLTSTKYSSSAPTLQTQTAINQTRNQLARLKINKDVISETVFGGVSPFEYLNNLEAMIRSVGFEQDPDKWSEIMDKSLMFLSKLNDLFPQIKGSKNAQNQTRDLLSLVKDSPNMLSVFEYLNNEVSNIMKSFGGPQESKALEVERYYSSRYLSSLPNPELRPDMVAKHMGKNLSDAEYVITQYARANGLSFEEASKKPEVRSAIEEMFVGELRTRTSEAPDPNAFTESYTMVDTVIESLLDKMGSKSSISTASTPSRSGSSSGGVITATIDQEGLSNKVITGVVDGLFSKLKLDNLLTIDFNLGEMRRQQGELYSTISDFLNRASDFSSLQNKLVRVSTAAKGMAIGITRVEKEFNINTTKRFAINPEYDIGEE